MALTYKAQAVEANLRRRGLIRKDQTLADWVNARHDEGLSIPQIASLIWAKSAGEQYVSERTLRNWFPDLSAKTDTEDRP